MPAPTPFFESKVRGDASAPRRRLLLLTYHFPPDGAVGGLRWEQMSKFFSASGWSIDVIMRDVAKLRSPDMRRMEQLPPHVRVYSAIEIEPWLARMESGMLRVVRSVRSRTKTARANASV